MRIIGIDPGTIVTGYGVIEWDRSGSSLVACGVIRTDPRNDAMSLRLRDIHIGVLAIIDEWLPDFFAIESAFYSKNVQSTLKLGHARGVSILAAALRELPTAEYAPREVKQSIVGTGNATKEQVAYMVRQMLKLNDDRLPLDATDALAIALCHGSKMSRPAAASRSWKQFVEQNPHRVG